MGLLTAFVSITDARAQSELLLDPYAREPIPVGAPVWMQDIAKDLTGVNYHKMDSLFTLWQAADNDARVKTLISSTRSTISILASSLRDKQALLNYSYQVKTDICDTIWIE
ncbi:hypothetical protein [Prevotella dentasini]|uniref:hypothetical protein n=1 Tax=Prevotella dentasini TaxID=589537 RepID=UPI00046A41ED|nr:hypothetical protein [Prevotella dentasini]